MAQIQTGNRLRLRRSDPWVTYAMIALCVVVFIWDTISSHINTVTYGFSAYGWPSALGMKDNAAIINGEWWRLITANFLHGGLQHIVFNMLSIYIWGRFVEMIYGHGRTALIILGSALGTTSLSFAFSAANSLGASGVAFGLMGALLAFGKYNRPLYQRFFGGGMTIMVVMNLLYGFFASSIDQFGHLGGLIGGYLVARTVGLLAYRRFTWTNLLCLVGYAAVIFTSLWIGTH
jgi:rhomboid protease GluP